MSEAYHSFYSIYVLPGNACNRNLQPTIVQALLLASPSPRCSEIIRPCVKKWIGEPFASSLDLCAMRVKPCAKYLPSYIMTCLIKTMFNAWNTFRRYRCASHVCRFRCGTSDGDDVLHYVVCPVSCTLLKDKLRRLGDEYGDGSPFTCFLPRLFPADIEAMLSMCVALDAAHNAFQ
eukprot:364094-Pyramimonas_sp.AAC.1